MCQKSQLVEIIEAQVNIPDREPKGDVIIFDGSALINASPPRTSKIFYDYAKEDTIPKVEYYGARYERVDVVFDVYKKSSLKSEMRSKRGQGIRKRVTGTSKTPGNWQSFLRDASNKTELFHFLGEKMCEAQSSSQKENMPLATQGNLWMQCPHVVLKKLTLEYLYMPGVQ